MFAVKSSFASAIAPEACIRRHGAQPIAMPSFLVWSDWQPLALSPSNGLALPEAPPPAVLAEVLDGGQAFRWGGLTAVQRYPNVSYIASLDELEKRMLTHEQ